jgi:hypothetical protein
MTKHVPMVALAICAACSQTPPADGLGHPPLAKPPANIVGGFSIQLPTTTLMPGDEQQPCWIFPVDLTGPSRLVGGAKLTVSRGMHHGNITTRPKTGEGIRPCDPSKDPPLVGGEGFDIANGGAVLFASSTQVQGEEWHSFPDGYAFPIKEGHEIVARMHYLNSSTQALDVAPKYEWFTIDASKIVQTLAPFAWTYSYFTIPPHAMHTVTGSCRLPPGMNVLMALPHMHKMGVGFDAAFLGGPKDGQSWLVSKGYDPDRGVSQMFQPAVDLSQGDGSTFSCSWNNTLDKPLVNGIGDNEMCILFGYAYPPEKTYSLTTSDSGGCIWAVAP